MVIGVLVELSNRSVDRIFDYAVPANLQNKIKVGIRVEVPFGKQILEGFVLEIKEDSEIDLKEMISVVDEDIILNDELLWLGKELSNKTLATLISCYQVMLPKALKAKNGININKKFDTYYRLNISGLEGFKFNDKQKLILDEFNNNELIPRKKLLDISSSSLNTLVKKGLLVEELVEHYRLNYFNDCVMKKKLTVDQEKVVNSVDILNNDNIYLLHGVTGSGKTEVYMEIIDKALALGKCSIVLVPEISLTPQMVDRFQKRFGDKIAAIHSGLSDGEKYDEWRRIARGEASIVIGARSAIFAPFNNIGVIIVDEEHSESYKQDDPSPRYSAIDVAIMRGKYHNCPIIMGSATPSLESYARAKKEVYKLLELPNRVNNKKLPMVTIVDMNKEIRRGKGHFSLLLLNSIREKLEKKEQVILLLNRRGYSSFITCKNCGYTFKCPNCDITLTYHKSSNTLRCHYCGYGDAKPIICPSCKEKSVNDLGVGTEKVEEELQDIFREARILRMDYDTTSRKGMHAKMISSFKNHEYDILLGTQIVAKGLDFEDVTLVGVINADTSLSIPDFRSSENTFSLLSQVAGRSGRSDKNGSVIIQTFNPDHYAVVYAKSHDYIGFYNKEMDIRKKLKYPPYYYICYVKISGIDMNLVYNEADKVKKSLDRNLNSSIILGPSPCMLHKLNNVYRYGIIIKYKKDDNLKDILSKILNHYVNNKKIRIDIDFNPSHF